MLLFLVIVAAAGVGLSYAITWLPVLLFGILLFLAVLIYTVPTSGILIAFGLAVACLVTLQISYLVAGVIFKRTESVASTSEVLHRTNHVSAKE